ncbi:MAG: cytochrome P450 [Rhodospirillaceae bacterium]
MFRRSKLDGPKGHPILGVLPLLRTDTARFFEKCSQQYGDLVPLRIFMTTAYLLNHPQHVEHVLQTNHRNYRKSPLVDRMKPLFGEGIFIAENEQWERQRKLIQPSFKRKNLQLLGDHIIRVIGDHLQAWEEKSKNREEFNLSEDMSTLTIDVLMQVFFGSSLADDGLRLYRAMQLINEVTAKRVWDITTLASMLPTRENRAYNSAIAEVHEVVAGMIDRRRIVDKNEVADDLLSILMVACDGDEVMTDDHLRDEIVTLMVAGFETTASLLVWAIYFMYENPHVLERVRSEADNTLQGRLPSNSDLKEMEYTKRVIQEVARLRPTVWWFSRTAIEDDIIGGESIKAGTTVLICQYVLHKLPSEWEDPERFDPDRFLPEKIARRSKFAYLPYGAGPRVCLGAGLANLEMQFILPLIYRKFDVEITSDLNPDIGNFISLRPKEDMRARITARLRH